MVEMVGEDIWGISRQKETAGTQKRRIERNGENKELIGMKMR